MPIPDQPRSKHPGFRTHKPGCRCHPCAAFRRKAEALTLPTGDGGTALDTVSPEVLDADLPVMVTGPQKDKKSGPNKDKWAREKVAQWVALRAVDPDITQEAAAKQIGISRRWLQMLIQRAATEGWLRFEDSLSRLEYVVVPKVVDNLEKFLAEGDKTITIETAKGTIFRQYQEVKGVNDAPQTILALKIEPAGGEVKIVTGQIVGAPRQLED